MQTPGFVWIGPKNVIQTVHVVPIYLKKIKTNQVEIIIVTPSHAW